MYLKSGIDCPCYTNSMGILNFFLIFKELLIKLLKAQEYV